mgnify:CR=1 FL=1
MPFVAIDRIDFDLSKCTVKQQKVTDLIKPIDLNTLVNSIILNWQLNVIIGLHRFVACKTLELNQIELKIDLQHRILEQIKLKTLLESNCSQGGEIITQPSKTMELTEELESTQKTLKPLAQNLEEVKRQAKLAAEARIKQWELQWQLQFSAFRSLSVNRPAKLVDRAVQTDRQSKSSTTVVDEIDVQAGDRWFLEPHLIYCGDTSSYEFIDSLPSNTALAIATPAPTWNHDYLIDAARVVAVLRSEGYVHELCRHHQMSFKFELLISDIYVGIFSRQSIPRPQRPIEIEGLEGIVSYLVNLYTDRGSFVILPFLGAGEVLIACERLGRICFAGDENPRLVSQAIARWQNLTGKQAYKLFYRS